MCQLLCIHTEVQLERHVEKNYLHFLKTLIYRLIGGDLYGLHMGICFAGTGLAELNIVLSPAYLHIGWVDHVLSLLGKLSVFNYNMKITGHTFLSLVGKVMEEQK